MSGAWANDPWGRHRFRWHDGATWTEHVSDGTSQGVDPVGPVGTTATPRPSSDEIIERLVQSARAAIDAQLTPRPPVTQPVAPPQAATPPQPAPPPQPAAPSRPAPPQQPPRATTEQPIRATPAPATVEVSAPGTTRRQIPWAWIAAGVAVPVAVWCLFNARDRDESASAGDVTVESTTTTTEAPATTTTVAAPETVDTVEVDSVPPGAVTAVPVEPADPQLVERCVEFAQFAAYIGDPEMAAFWTNAGLNVDTLRANCAALPPSELERLSQRKADMDLFMAGAPAP